MMMLSLLFFVGFLLAVNGQTPTYGTGNAFDTGVTNTVGNYSSFGSYNLISGSYGIDVVVGDSNFFQNSKIGNCTRTYLFIYASFRLV